jgi:hypothetical protein
VSRDDFHDADDKPTAAAVAYANRYGIAAMTLRLTRLVPSVVALSTASDAEVSSLVS